MKKVLIALAVAALLPIMASCTKTCNCTSVTKGEVTDPEMAGEIPESFMNGTSTATAETKGKCSELNGVQEQNMIWYKLTVTTTCE